MKRKIALMIFINVCNLARDASAIIPPMIHESSYVKIIIENDSEYEFIFCFPQTGTCQSGESLHFKIDRAIWPCFHIKIHGEIIR